MFNWHIRPALDTDLAAVKQLFDTHRAELGFVVRPALEKAVHSHELLVAVNDTALLGAVHYHHRRDGQTTLYHIAVDERARRQTIGTALISALRADCAAHNSRCILLKCPTELPANQFYEKLGFQHERTEPGKHRALKVWIMRLSPPT